MFRSLVFPLLVASMAALPAQTQGWQNLGHGLAGSAGVPLLSASPPQIGLPLVLSLSSARPSSLAYFVIGLGRWDYPVLGGTLVPMVHGALPAITDSSGSAAARILLPRDPTFVGVRLFLQAVVFDPRAPQGLAFCPALEGTILAGPSMYQLPRLVDPFSGDAVEAGRIDSDSHADFAVSEDSADQIHVRYGSGAGLFPNSQTWAMGNGPSDIDLGDFDGDGMTDVIATNQYDGRVRIRWGSSNLGTWSFFSTGAGPWRVRTGDLNADGLDDFVTLNRGGDDITVRLSQGAGAFSSTTYGAGGTGQNDIQLGDLDGDGDLDMVYVVKPGGMHAILEVRLNDGSGSFGSPTTVDMASNHGDNFHAMALGDLDEDSHLDIVAARSSGHLVRVLGNGDGTFQAPVADPVPANPWRIYMHDLDLDGHLDLVVAHLIGQGVTIYMGQGNGNVTGPFHVKTPATLDVRDVDVADFDEDGKPDLVLACSSGTYVRLAN